MNIWRHFFCIIMTTLFVSSCVRAIQDGADWLGILVLGIWSFIGVLWIWTGDFEKGMNNHV